MQFTVKTLSWVCGHWKRYIVNREFRFRGSDDPSLRWQGDRLWVFWIDPSLKSHNAPVAYPTMPHFVTEMTLVCTFLSQNSAFWGGINWISLLVLRLRIKLVSGISIHHLYRILHKLGKRNNCKYPFGIPRFGQYQIKEHHCYRLSVLVMPYWIYTVIIRLGIPWHYLRRAMPTDEGNDLEFTFTKHTS